MLPLCPFLDFAISEGLFDASSRVLAAVSGGMDSVLMIHLLKAAGIPFGIAHCNFRLRDDESAGDQLFCETLSRQLDVPFHTIDFDTRESAGEKKISIQMAARQLRYTWFEQTRQQSGYDVIALAHHQNDAIETILLNLTRGTGIAGMHGILPKNGNLVRPMLFLRKDEIAKTVVENDISYREDSSNASDKYARNRIRLDVIPVLTALNPSLEQTFAQNLQRFKELEQLLEASVTAAKHDIFIAHQNEIQMPVAKLKALHPMRLILYGLLSPFGFNETTVADVAASLNKQPGKLFESAGYTLLLDRQHLILKPKTREAPLQVLLHAGTKELQYGDRRLSILSDDSPLIVKNNPFAASVDTAKLLYPLTLRSWQQGDSFRPFGMKGSKKVSDLLISARVPLTDKQNIPLLINGNGDIIWVAGHRLDERYKVTEGTRKVTIFELFK